MHNLTLGYNFDEALISVIEQLNKEFKPHGARIKGVYGSDREHAYLSARPDFRLPEVSAEDLAMHVQRLADIGVEFNYTMNSPSPGNTKRVFNDVLLGEFLDWCTFLVNIGVKRFIISNPMLIDIISKRLPDLDVKLELSTIMHIDTPMQLQAFKQMDKRVDKVVGNILYNRDFRHLETLVAAAKRFGIDYEVMVNEFCLVTSGQGNTPVAAHCIYRDSCYGCHAGNVTKDDAKLLNNYPMSKCMSSRAHQTADWLRTFFVRPQDLRYYMYKGITDFKVTGRTAKTPYIEAMARAYLSEEFSGNLLNLWKPLETIYSEKDELSEHQHKIYIPTERLDGFIEPFFNGNINCNELLCEDCRFCDSFAMSLDEEE